MGVRMRGAVLLASSLALSAALAPPALAEGATATLRVGVPAGPDPVAGFDRSLFAEAAREAGLGVVFAVMPPGAALDALGAGRIDVAAGPFRPGDAPGRAAAGRRATGFRSALPLASRLASPLALLAPDGDALLKRRGDGSVKLPGDAAGKTVGLLGPAPIAASIAVPIPAATAARLRAGAGALRARAAAAAPRAFADPLGDLAAGRVAALVGALPDVAAAALARPEGFEVVGLVPGRAGAPPSAGAALVRADRPDLADRLGAAIGRMRADGRLAAVQRRWFGVALDSSPPGQPAAASATAKP